MLYVVTLVITMLHMAYVDGEYAPAEKKYINKILSLFTQYQSEINRSVSYFNSSIQKEKIVIELLSLCKKKFSKQEMRTLITHSAKVLTVDGYVHEQEQFLMKSYIFAAGLPIKTYDDLIHEIQYS